MRGGKNIQLYTIYMYAMLYPMLYSPCLNMNNINEKQQIFTWRKMKQKCYYSLIFRNRLWIGLTLSCYPDVAGVTEWIKLQTPRFDSHMVWIPPWCTLLSQMRLEYCFKGCEPTPYSLMYYQRLLFVWSGETAPYEIPKFYYIILNIMKL